MRHAPTVVLLALTSSAAGCHAPAVPTQIPAELRSPFPGYQSATYSIDQILLCHPGLASDACSADLRATEIAADGKRTVVPHQPAKEPKDKAADA